MENVLKAIVSFGALTATMVGLAQIPALRADRAIATNPKSQSKITRTPTAIPAGEAMVNLRSGQMRVGDRTISIAPSPYIPRGTYTIGTPEFSPIGDGGRGRIFYPFKSVEWRELDDRNPLKARMRSLEQREGFARKVAYSVHSAGVTGVSEGCVVVSNQEFEAIKAALPGTKIVID